MRRSRHLAAALAATVLAACSAPAPPPPPQTIAAGADTLLLPSADAAKAVFLGGDRWAVLSPEEGIVDLVDFGTHRTSQLGGKGTKEIKNAYALFRQADTLFVADWGLHRLTKWTTDGTLRGTVDAPSAAGGALPLARDAAGQFYAERAPDPGRDGSGNRDSAAVIRLLADGRADTVARLSPLDVAEVESEAGRRFERRVFSGRDLWDAAPDGSIWVARVYHNRVDWRDATGKVVIGQALPDRVLEVTKYDRELFLRKFPPDLRTRAEQLPFAPIKAPFEAAFTGDDARVWLEKSRAPNDSARAYHVVGRDGKLLHEIRLAGDGRILAVGGGVALAAERIAGGFRLSRIPVTLP